VIENWSAEAAPRRNRDGQRYLALEPRGNTDVSIASRLAWTNIYGEPSGDWELE
jgi:hypothetical protein